MSTIYRILTKDEFPQALEIRIRVFVEEQNVPIGEEQDRYDQTAVHFGAFAQDTMIGTGRVVIEGKKGKCGRIAFLNPTAVRGIGMGLLQTMIEWCRAQGLTEVYLGAQLHAIPFYEKAGFTAEGGVFDDAGIPHRLMRKQLK